MTRWGDGWMGGGMGDSGMGGGQENGVGVDDRLGGSMDEGWVHGR